MAKAKIYLYKEGNECISLTGGWNSFKAGTATIGTLTKESDCLSVKNTSSNQITNIFTNNIPFTNYEQFINVSSICRVNSYLTSSNVGCLGFSTSRTSNSWGTENVVYLDKDTKPFTKIFNISKSYDNNYVGISVVGSNIDILQLYFTTKENVITINSQENNNITFSANDLGLVTISKIDVLVNGIVSKTYTDEYSKLSYTVDKSLCYIGNNNIEIRVTYSQGDDITETVSEYLTYKHNLPQLPLETPLLDTVERVKLLTKTKQNEKNMLSSILTSKNVEVSEEDKMSDLIGKVDSELINNKLYLYKDGNEYVDVTGGFEQGGYVRGTSINMTKNDNSISLKVYDSGSQTISFVNNSKLSFSGYSKLCINYMSDTTNATNTNCSICIGTSNSTTSTAPSYLVLKHGLALNCKNIAIIDITNINIEGYIQLTCDKWTTTHDVNIEVYQIWLEK